MRFNVRCAIAIASVLACACTRRDAPISDAPSSIVPKAAAAVAEPASAAAAPAAPAPTFRAVGRFVPDGEGLRFAWSGSYVVGRFKGTTVSMRLKDEGYNLFQVVVDGEVKRVLKTDPRKDLYVLVDGLPDGVHDISVHRRTEAKVGEAVFYEFVGDMLPAPPAPDRRIELIGDSITTGYGNEGPGAKCGYVNSEQNEYLTYGALAARALGADHTTIAWSGKTLYEMKTYFDKALPARDDSTWDFSQYQPHVVVINVGTNNFALFDPGEKVFVDRYLALFEKVRAAYPSALIVCALGPMLTDKYPEGHNNLTQARKYMKVVMAKLRASDDNVDFIEFPEQKHSDGLGCGFHPSLKTHQLMADRLVPLLKERMGW